MYYKLGISRMVQNILLGLVVSQSTWSYYTSMTYRITGNLLTFQSEHLHGAG